MNELQGKLCRAKTRTFGGWRGVGVITSNYNDIVTLVPVGEDINDKWKRKTYLRSEVSILRNQTQKTSENGANKR